MKVDREQVIFATAMIALAAIGIGWMVIEARAAPPGLDVSPATGADATYRYVITPETGARIDAGERVEILPATLVAAVGEVLQVVNDDDRGHLVGPFFVDAGQTLTQRFDAPGRIVGLCTVHPDGELAIEVVA